MIWLIFLILGCEMEEVYTVMDTAMDCDMVSYANVGEPFMTQYCIGCHGMVSSNRQGAPLEVTLDSMDNILNHLDTIRHEVRCGDHATEWWSNRREHRTGCRVARL